MAKKGRPIVLVEQPQCLVHYGYINSWQDYDGYGSIWRQYLEPHKMGKRYCRWIEAGDWVCADIHMVTCPLCLKSKAANKERQRPKLKRNMETAESRLFWASVEKSVKEYDAKYTPEQRFRNYVMMHQGDRIKQVAKHEREYYPNGPWKIEFYGG